MSPGNRPGFQVNNFRGLLLHDPKRRDQLVTKLVSFSFVLRRSAFEFAGQYNTVFVAALHISRSRFANALSIQTPILFLIP